MPAVPLNCGGAVTEITERFTERFVNS
ncbi:MAG: hypothetical protein QOC63_6277, partial [Mycobacterium sp.]|nr:hypothetical protein [Mycobacterium sp.]